MSEVLAAIQQVQAAMSAFQEEVEVIENEPEKLVLGMKLD
jgi:hypothetical protein